MLLKPVLSLSALVGVSAWSAPAAPTVGPFDLRALTTPIIFKGDALTAYRDPAAIYHEGMFHLYFTQMGRMIDPFLLEDKDEPGKWWCFFKQSGASLAWSRDLSHWTYAGHVAAGENVCVIVADGQYVMFHSTGNGINLKRSPDLKVWREGGKTTLGQSDWAWARGQVPPLFPRQRARRRAHHVRQLRQPRPGLER